MISFAGVDGVNEYRAWNRSSLEFGGPLVCLSLPYIGLYGLRLSFHEDLAGVCLTNIDLFAIYTTAFLHTFESSLFE